MIKYTKKRNFHKTNPTPIFFRINTLMTSETQKCQSSQKVVRDVDWVMFNPDLDI